jgi:conjugal transfer pilus assembly protein TraB
MMLIGGAVTGILGLAGAGMFLFDSGPAQHREKPKTVSITAPGTVDDKDAWRAQRAAKEKSNETLDRGSKTQLKVQEEQNKKLAQALEELKANKAAAGSAAATAAKPDASVLDKPLPIGNGTGPGQRVLQSPNGKGGPTALDQPLNQVDVPARRSGNHHLQQCRGQGCSRRSKWRRWWHHRGAGLPDRREGQEVRHHFGRGGRRSRPSSSCRPAPLCAWPCSTAWMRRRASKPNRTRCRWPSMCSMSPIGQQAPLDIKDCRIVAATWGDLSSERMMGRTETLACVINGEAVEMAIKGQVIGEDGKAGVRGRLVTKQGQLLANALFAGALSGIGKAFQSSATITSTGGGGITQTIDPDKIGQAAIGGGVGSAGQQLAQYYLKAADKLYPVIETDGGRTVEILITKGAVYSGKALAKDDYRGLLKRTGTNSRRYEDD